MLRSHMDIVRSFTGDPFRSQHRSERIRILFSHGSSHSIQLNLSRVDPLVPRSRRALVVPIGV